MKFCLSFRRKTSSNAHHPMAMVKPADLSSEDDLTDFFKSLSMHKEPVSSTETIGTTQNSTQVTYSTQYTTESTPPTQTSTQITVPTQSPPPPTNSAQVPAQQSFSSPLPIFPVPRPPICGKCHNSCTRRIVSASNKNNNADRPFYICKVCKEDPNIPGRYTEKGWISWDDGVGVRDTNKACYCGVACRQDRAGFESRYPGGGFWTCAYGRCRYLSYRKDFLTEMEAIENGLDPFADAFVPWLL